MNEYLEIELYKKSYHVFYENSLNKLKEIGEMIEENFKVNEYTLNNFLELQNYNGTDKINSLIDKIENAEKAIDNIETREDLESATDKLVELLKRVKEYEMMPQITTEIREKLEEEEHYNNILLKKELEEFLNKKLKMITINYFISFKNIQKNYVSNLSEIIEILNNEKELWKVLNILIDLSYKLRDEEAPFSFKYNESNLYEFENKVNKLNKKGIKNLSPEKLNKLKEKLSSEINYNIIISDEKTNIMELYYNLFSNEAKVEYETIFSRYFHAK